jgi:Mg2+ and Co2+ transporter CorA
VTINHMIDLMYKSVSIRDARLSLELNASLWRLSWITFIFLPLTFLVGFFGMNIDPFVEEAPSLKWYFIAAVPLMVVIFLGWMFFKHFITDSHGVRRRLEGDKNKKSE